MLNKNIFDGLSSSSNNGMSQYKNNDMPLNEPTQYFLVIP